MTTQVTPAGRLYALLEGIKQAPGNIQVTDAWSLVLDIPVDRWAELLRAYSLVVCLPDEIAAEVKAIDLSLINIELAMSWEPSIRAALDIDFARGVPVDHLRTLYDGEAMAHLRWCDDMLRRHRLGGSELQQSALEDITSKIEDLEHDLADPDIDLELRYLLLTHTRAMKQAVRDVRIRGRAGLEEALDQALGDVYIRRPKVTKRDPRRTGKLIAILQAASLALQISLTLVQIEQANRPPLPPRVNLSVGIDVHPPRALPPGQAASSAPADVDVCVDSPESAAG